jgi:hypothetical protein
VDRWGFHHFEPCRGYVGALAIDGHGHQLRLQPLMTVDALLDLIARPGPLLPG